MRQADANKFDTVFIYSYIHFKQRSLKRFLSFTKKTEVPLEKVEKEGGTSFFILSEIPKQLL